MRKKPLYQSIFFVFIAWLIGYLLYRFDREYGLKKHIPASAGYDFEMSDNIKGKEPLAAAGVYEPNMPDDVKAVSTSNKPKKSKEKGQNNASTEELLSKLLDRSEPIDPSIRAQLYNELKGIRNRKALDRVLSCYLTSPYAGLFFRPLESSNNLAMYEPDTKRIIFSHPTRDFFVPFAHELYHACFSLANNRAQAFQYTPNFSIELLDRLRNNLGVKDFSQNLFEGAEQDSRTRIVLGRSMAPYDVGNKQQQDEFRSAFNAAINRARSSKDNNPVANTLLGVENFVKEVSLHRANIHFATRMQELLATTIPASLLKKLGVELQKTINEKTIDHDPSGFHKKICKELEELLKIEKDPWHHYLIRSTLKLMQMAHDETMSEEAKAYHLDSEISAYILMQLVEPSGQKLTKYAPELLAYIDKRIQLSIQRQQEDRLDSIKGPKI